MAVLWEPSDYSEPEATRVNICFAPSQEALKELKAFDDWSVETLSAESARLFGTNLDLEEVKRRYTGTTSLRCKAVKCLDTFRNPRSLPESWISCAVTPRIALGGYWCMGKECSALLEIQHAMLDEAVHECPF